MVRHSTLVAASLTLMCLILPHGNTAAVNIRDGTAVKMVVAAIVLVGPAIVATTASCTNDMDCSLNGVCTSGSCHCDPAWNGSACDRLATLPTDRAQPVAAYGGDSQPQPESQGARTPNVSSWGGNILRGDDGRYHLWVSEFVNDCGLAAWRTNSQIAHATAITVTGPFVKRDVALGIFSHNVVPLRAPGRSPIGHPRPAHSLPLMCHRRC
jgi:hypothetical protein